ncbi:MAG: IreB family regulatory phosphoprotein [Clostridiaceae bacterium]|nr:IreB family regulatory phosphoprotein [Clostridiaceae bacterium]
MDNNTVFYKRQKEQQNETRIVLTEVYEALKEKGYNPISQLVGYIMSGDPTYITNHKNARALVTRVERDEIVEELFKYYLETPQD